jgi:hypothetical protein
MSSVPRPVADPIPVAAAPAALRPASEALLRVRSSGERAEALRREGARVLEREGVAWVETRPGFFEPVHLLARIPAAAASRPTIACWGFRATVRDEDSDRANGDVPLHVLDLAGYDLEGVLSPRRRSKLRKTRREASYVQLADASLLRSEGHALYVSHLGRTRHRRVPSQAQYLATVERLFTSGDVLVIAALVGDRLGGYVHGSAVDGVGYLEDVVVGSEFLPHQLGLGLNAEFILACQRTAGLHTLVHGLHAREDPGLDEFKAGLGIRVARIPARVGLPWPLRAYLRARRPHVYYRLTGR